MVTRSAIAVADPVFVPGTSSVLGEREAIADVARNVERWVDVMVLRTYAHDTITEMAAHSRVPVLTVRGGHSEKI